MNLPSARTLRDTVLCLLLAAGWLALPSRASDRFTVSWTNNLLTLRHPQLPGGSLDAYYLEAFLRTGANQQNWGKSVLPHKTQLLAADQKSRWLKFHTEVQPGVEVLHEVRAKRDAVEVTFKIRNRLAEPVDLQWFQPACIRVATFTGRDQQSFIDRSFIYTAKGRT